MSKYLCLDIGGTKMLGTIIDEDQKILFEVKKKTKASEGEEMIDARIAEIISELLVQNGGKDDIIGIGAGAPGIITEQGELVFAPNIPWKNYPIKKIIEDKFGIPFFIANDVNVGTLGEWKYGAAKGKSHVLGLFMGTGIGGGIIIDGKLFAGSSFAGGEVGHITINPDGPYCNCGSRGCLEAYASKIAINTELVRQIQRGRTSTLAGSIDKNGVIKSSLLKKALMEGDALVQEVLDRAARFTAAGIGSMLNVLNPEIVVLGGGVIEAVGGYLLPKIIEETKRYTMPTIFEACQIVEASLGDHAGVYGAMALVQMMRKDAGGNVKVVSTGNVQTAAQTNTKNNTQNSAKNNTKNSTKSNTKSNTKAAGKNAGKKNGKK